MDKLMIHNIKEEFFRLDLTKYQLTFDDGLYSQYYYSPLFKNSKHPNLFFITTGFIRDGKARKVFDGKFLPYVKSRNYMYEVFIKNRFDQFMKVDELQRLAHKKNVAIGAHSHFHDIIMTTHPLKKPLSPWKIEHLPCLFESKLRFSINRRSKLAYPGYFLSDTKLMKRSTAQWLDYVKRDTESCLLWFEKYLGFLPTSYSFPFNEYTSALVEILKGYGFKDFYNGKSVNTKDIFGRIDIDTLVSTQSDTIHTSGGN